MRNFIKILSAVVIVVGIMLGGIAFYEKKTEQPLGLSKIRIGQQILWTTDLEPDSDSSVNLGSEAKRVLYGWFDFFRADKATTTNATTTGSLYTKELAVGSTGNEYYFPPTRGTLNQILKINGSGNITWQADTGGAGEAAWEYDATNFGLTPTTTGSGIYLTGSATTTANLYATGYATTTGGLYTQGLGHIGGSLSVDGSITGSNLNISNWDTAYGWGDHSIAGYTGWATTSTDFWETKQWRWATTSADYWLTIQDTGDLTEGANLYYTQARVWNDVWASTTEATILNNAQTAYSWGDHSLAGYYAAADFATDWASYYNATSTLNGLDIYTTSDIDAHLSGGTGITYSSGVISFDCSEVEGTGINCSGEAITLDNTGAWAGTYSAFGSDFYTYFNATNTDALGEGSTNLYQDSELTNWIDNVVLNTNGSIDTEGYASSTTGLFTQGSGHLGGNLTVDGDLTIVGNNDYSDLVAGDIPDISATYSVLAGNASLITVGTLTLGSTGAGFTVDLDSSTLTCTNCLTTSNIADSYVLNTSDTMTGGLTMNSATTTNNISIGGTASSTGIMINGLFEVDSSGYVTTTADMVIGADSGAKKGCLVMRDTDNGGWTYCYVLDGDMTCGTADCTGVATSTIMVGHE